MLSTKYLTGKIGENYVKRYIQEKLRWTILAMNFHSRFGEIDIIAHDGEEIVFVEVKTRKSSTYGTPQESVTHTKLRKMTQTAQLYLLQYGKENDAYRFDVITVYGNDSKKTIEHFKNVSETT